MLREYLEAEGFGVETVLTGPEGVQRALSGDCEAVILDIMLPHLNGMDALRQIRQSSDVPVIMLTARGDQIDRVVGLELGADDYIAKPYFPRELVARLRAVLRRKVGKAEGEITRLADGYLDIDVAARRARWRGKSIDLTATEFNMLASLMRAGKDVATKDALSQTALGRARQSYDRSVDVHVSNLRGKLAASSHGVVSIETVRGVGYRLQVGS